MIFDSDLTICYNIKVGSNTNMASEKKESIKLDLKNYFINHITML